MARSRKKIGEHLVRWGVIDQNQLKEALKVSQGTSKRIGEVLVDLSYVTEDDVAKALASQFDLEYIDIDHPGAVKAENPSELIPHDMIRKFSVIPVERNNGKIKVLMGDPLDLNLLDMLRFRLGAQIEPAIGSRKKIDEYIDRSLSKTRESIDETVREMSVDRGMSLDRGQSMDRGQSLDRGQSMDRGMSMDRGRSMDRGASMDRGMSMDRGASMDRGDSIDIAGLEMEGDQESREDSAPIVRLVHKIISEAVEARASDIHVEPMVDRVRLRYRIDGVCHEREDVPKQMQAPLVARMKLMAGMKIDQRRLPQDGRIKLKIEGDQVDFRVSACPAYHGESLVLRILKPESVRIGLPNLGFERDMLDQFNRIIRRPNGIFLVTGPTGSGKTTTLYSALDVLNHSDRKILTAEDPVEYNFSGINQTQVREDIGLDFARILRAMLRQAPNIILVGEIRDKEVADVAIQAALTGHLVFSTLHTNDAPSALTRLIDMGVKPFLAASSVQAVMAQRLVRVLCDECKEPDPHPNPYHLRLCGIDPEEVEPETIFRPVGCPRCSRTGFRGRKAIFELMTMNTEIRELANQRVPAGQIREAAEAGGMRDLAADGRLKVLSGVTTPEEVSRVAQVSGFVDMEEQEEVVQ